MRDGMDVCPLSLRKISPSSTDGFFSPFSPSPFLGVFDPSYRSRYPLVMNSSLPLTQNTPRFAMIRSRTWITSVYSP